jgi:hypothetical protein
VGKGIVKDKKGPSAISLDLPFSNYNQTSDWEDDDRSAVLQAGQFILGDYDPMLNLTVKSAAVKAKFQITSHFSRRDDVRLATQLSLWESYLKYPFYFQHIVDWRRRKLGIPINITVESINGNIDYKENDWLSKSKIFPMRMEVTVRTYQVLIHDDEGIVNFPMRFFNHAEVPYDGDSYIVSETYLDFGSTKFGYEVGIEDSKEKVATEDEVLPDTPNQFTKAGNVDVYKGESTLELDTSGMWTHDIIEGYFHVSPTSMFDELYIDEEKSTPHSLFIKYQIKPSEFKYFEDMLVYVTARSPITVDHYKQKELVLTGLTQDSDYEIQFVVHTTEGEKSLAVLKGHTKAEDPKVESKSESLVGWNW